MGEVLEAGGSRGVLGEGLQMGFKWTLLRLDRRPLPSSLMVYCLCPRASITVPDLSHLRLN